VKTVVYIVLLLLSVFCIGVGTVGYTTPSFVDNFIPDTREVHILFVGDMMFDRTIRSKATVKGYDFLFSCVHDYLKSFDWVIANLEGSITNNESLSMGTKPGEAYKPLRLYLK
jgi:Bacterial capsule synthesis protein PGA_cap